MSKLNSVQDVQTRFGPAVVRLFVDESGTPIVNIWTTLGVVWEIDGVKTTGISWRQKRERISGGSGTRPFTCEILTTNNKVWEYGRMPRNHSICEGNINGTGMIYFWRMLPSDPGFNSINKQVNEVCKELAAAICAVHRSAIKDAWAEKEIKEAADARDFDNWIAARQQFLHDQEGGLKHFFNLIDDFFEPFDPDKHEIVPGAVIKIRHKNKVMTWLFGSTTDERDLGGEPEYDSIEGIAFIGSIVKALRIEKERK